MKNSILILTLFLTFFGFSQKEDKLGRVIDYNRLSIEANVGQGKAIAPYQEGFFSSDTREYFAFTGVNHFDFGVRYMFNPKFGLKLDGAYDIISDNGIRTQEFETKQYRIGIQGVINLRSLLEFDSWTKRFGLLAHAGIQASILDPQTFNSGITEDNGGIMIGATPQFRITKRLVLTADITYLYNVRQHLSWEGFYSEKSNNLTGSMIHASAGLTFYLGKHDVHADFYTPDLMKDDTMQEESLAEINEKIDKLNDLLKDSDDDGVIDAFDLQPNTPAGTLVDTRGRPLDIESYIDMSKFEGGTKTDIINQVADSDLGNIFFDLNVSVPQEASANKIYQLIQLLKKEESIKLRLLGYADKRGGSILNQKLSERRAQNVAQILTDNGIAPSRIIEVSGGGVDETVYQNNEIGLQMARRVSVELE